jgi:hypothetical protein
MSRRSTHLIAIAAILALAACSTVNETTSLAQNRTG